MGKHRFVANAKLNARDLVVKIAVVFQLRIVQKELIYSVLMQHFGKRREISSEALWEVFLSHSFPLSGR